jgi:hypothetical protein
MTKEASDEECAKDAAEWTNHLQGWKPGSSLWMAYVEGVHSAGTCEPIGGVYRSATELKISPHRHLLPHQENVCIPVY